MTGLILPLIFLSHSSTNNPEAVALRDWLIAEGWDDLFLDLDQSRGISPGERWERALSEAANRCEAVIFLVSRAWLASAWCLREFYLAAKLNKRMFGVLVEDITIAELPAEVSGVWQLVNLAQGSDHAMFRATLPDGGEAHVTFSKSALIKLRAGLVKAGLDARFFAWPPENDPDRPPYRGMRPLEGEDAGIFFGRAAPIIEALDRLRRLSEAGQPRFLVILGASGAGKSSFLRAGLMPRLLRDDRNFLPLPVVRPERAAISGETGFIRSLEAAITSQGLKRTRAEIKIAVEAGASAVLPFLAELADSARFPGFMGEPQSASPRLVLAIDQGEELFLAEGIEESQAFLTLVRDLATAPSSNLVVLVAIRSDAYDRLQTVAALEGVRQETFSLPPLPRGAYQMVIEGPAARLADSRRPLRIDPALTAALLADIEAGGAKDALPLLAFTLERLYVEHGGDGDLRLSEYRELGGIKGSIEAAVERALKAADSDPAIPRDRAARLTLLRRALIPWLAGIDPETGSPRRRVARLSEIPKEARPLVEHLVGERLLATDVSPVTGERTIEPAHEALLRQWSLLQGWLEQDFAALSALEGVKRAVRDWDANARAEDWLAHTAGRLDDAEALMRRDDIARFLDPTDLAYLAACRAVDTARRHRELEEARKLAEAEKKASRRTRIGLIAASMLAAAAIGGAVFGFAKASEAIEQARIASEQAELARQQTAEAVRNESVSLAALSTSALAEGRPADALQLAMAAWPRAGDAQRPRLKRVVESLAAAIPADRERVRLAGYEHKVEAATFSPDGRRLLTVSEDTTARIWDATTGVQIAILPHEDILLSGVFSPDGTRVLATSGDGGAYLWDVATETKIAKLAHNSIVHTATFSSDGAWVLTASEDTTAKIWDAATGAVIAVFRHDDAVKSAVFSPDGAHVVTTSAGKGTDIWDAATGANIASLLGEYIGGSGAFSPDGARMVTASREKTARIRNARTGGEITVLPHNEIVGSAVFSADGNRILTMSGRKTASVWDAATGRVIAILRNDDDMSSAAFSHDGTRILTTSWSTRWDRGTTRLWSAAEGSIVADLVGHEGRINSAAFSPDGMWVVTASYDKTARIWDARTGAEVAVLEGDDGVVWSAAFSPDSTRVMTTSAGTAFRIGQPTSVHVFEVTAKTGVLDHNNEVSSASFSPDGARIVTTSDNGTARVLDAQSEAIVKILRGHEGSVSSAVFSPDGRSVVTASADKTARVWDAETGREVATLRGHQGPVLSAFFSPDGAHVLTTSIDNTARVWNAMTGVEIAAIGGHEVPASSFAFSQDGLHLIGLNKGGGASIWDLRTDHEIQIPDAGGMGSSAAFSPDGTRVLTAGLFSGPVRIWDAVTGAPLVLLQGPRSSASSASFSPDGARLVTTEIHEIAGVWDARTGAEIAILSGHKGMIFSAAFSPDGTRVVTASADGTARMWDAATGAELGILRLARGVYPTGVVLSPNAAFVLAFLTDGRAVIWDVSELEKGDGFAVACVRMARRISIPDIRARYGLGEIDPICGDHPPLPADPGELQ